MVLGIESSCDETAAAVVRGPGHVLSNVVATQHELHAEYAGVVPEIASRAHLERIEPVIVTAVRAAGITLADLDAVAVGHRPGLIGSLLVGVSAAKALAWSLDVPLVGVDHVHAHLYAGGLSGTLPLPEIAYPALGLVVSGGHTSLYRLTDPLAITRLGRTIDDAVGEAFDKAATLLELGYPGGPAIDRLAVRGDDTTHDFPIARLDNPLDFSFSGLKTALLYAVRGHPVGRGPAATFPRSAADLSDAARADCAASFQRAAVTAVIRNTRRALESTSDTRSLLVGGGVAANTRLRRELGALADERGVTLRIPEIAYCLDNGAMIAGLASQRLDRGEADELTLSAATRVVV
ncbi:MAG: tRNA (adenosine(37)-N6)-threonylcarbamoyltransferase complex transferase subunit TsaD [Phycisphaerales bacterium]|nr:tRNA (adenosine(37)-N6)-threonylcarbamoyltransferase complex transferase subunit TsaD [Phycisphaerae bacterium]NNF44261.1 tRNA (adenosine(37)-N6)-threonylcarbamoyltransferase complex transferase subunit TsaD [Phycisphaerales bacterium]NNM26915.1 tRNA (adenosine(37)-N6)-threonylcarbamoyltransferase complex transferase subunit TsaD [Phycisphaerales bacterium]